MAKKKRGKNKFRGFINYKLSESDKSGIGHCVENGEDYTEEIADLVESGYSITVSWDFYSDCFSATAVGKYTDDKSKGRGISFRHPDFDKAVWSLVHIIGRTLPNGDWVDAKPIEDEYDW